MGLLDPKLQNELDSNPGHFAYEANTLSVALLGEISIEYLNLTALYLSVLLKFTCTVYHLVGVVKCFVVYYIL